MGIESEDKYQFTSRDCTYIPDYSAHTWVLVYSTAMWLSSRGRALLLYIWSQTPNGPGHAPQTHGAKAGAEVDWLRVWVHDKDGWIHICMDGGWWRPTELELVLFHSFQYKVIISARTSCRSSSKSLYPFPNHASRHMMTRLRSGEWDLGSTRRLRTQASRFVSQSHACQHISKLSHCRYSSSSVFGRTAVISVSFQETDLIRQWLRPPQSAVWGTSLGIPEMCLCFPNQPKQIRDSHARKGKFQTPIDSFSTIWLTGSNASSRTYGFSRLGRW